MEEAELALDVAGAHGFLQPLGIIQTEKFLGCDLSGRFGEEGRVALKCAKGIGRGDEGHVSETEVFALINVDGVAEERGRIGGRGISVGAVVVPVDALAADIADLHTAESADLDRSGKRKRRQGFAYVQFAVGQTVADDARRGSGGVELVVVEIVEIPDCVFVGEFGGDWACAVAAAYLLGFAY